MGFVNQTGDLAQMFLDVDTRVRRLEAAKTFNFPYVNATPALPQNGDAWVRSDLSKVYAYINNAVTELSTSGIPTGVVNPFAGSAAPSGWLLCYGQAISRTTYSALFTTLGTIYGAGDGSTTFNLPDLRGRTVAGVDNMGGTTASRITSGVTGITGTTLGAAGGDQNTPLHSHANTASFSGSFTGNAASHNHTQDGHNHNRGVITTGGSPNNPGAYIGSSSASVWYTNGGSGYTADSTGTGAATATNQATSITPTGSITGSVTMSNANAGTGTAANVQPTIMLNYIIKT